MVKITTKFGQNHVIAGYYNTYRQHQSAKKKGFTSYR